MSEGTLPSAAETGAATDPSPKKTEPAVRATEATRPLTPDQLAARTLAGKIIDRVVKDSEAKRRTGEPLSGQEQDLYAIGTIGRGFLPSEVGGGKELPLFRGKGLEVTGKDSTGTEITGTAVAITDQQFDTEGRVASYICKTDSGETVIVSRDAMKQRFIQELAPSIVSSVRPEQQEIVSWYATGEQTDPPKEAVAKELDPITTADRIIQQRIDELKTRLQLNPKDKELQKQLVQLELAKKADGEFGPAIKHYRLQQIAETDPSKAKAINEIINTPEFKTKVQEATNKLREFLEANGFNKKILEKISQEGYAAIAENDKLLSKLMKKPEFIQKFFNKTPDDKEIDKMADDAGLTPEQKAKLEKEGGGKKGLLLILLLLLASPIIIGGGIAIGTVPIMQKAFTGEH